jgi:uncharacterized DUF497 family protein
MYFDWNPEKNEWLKKNRKISFEEISLLLAEGKVWKVAKHPNVKKYPQQMIFLLTVDGYVYFVPYVVEGEKIFLKTAFPHRGATKVFLTERKQDG